MIIPKRGRGVLLLACVLAMSAASVQAGLLYDPNAGVSQITGVLNGPGLAVSNLAVTRGVSQQYGIFNGGAAGLGG